MFIMKKDLFFRYNEFLFPILFELERRIDTSMYGYNYGRILGSFSEHLMNIFIKQIEINNEQPKIKYLYRSFIKDASTDTYETIEPCFSDNYVPIVFLL